MLKGGGGSGKCGEWEIKSGLVFDGEIHDFDYERIV